MLSWMIKAPSKILATFVVSILVFLVVFAFFPNVLIALQDFSEYIDGYTRNPPIDDQGKALFRVFVNENTLLAVMGTVFARSVVEIVSMAGGEGWRLMRRNPRRKESHNRRAY